MKNSNVQCVPIEYNKTDKGFIDVLDVVTFIAKNKATLMNTKDKSLLNQVCSDILSKECGNLMNGFLSSEDRLLKYEYKKKNKKDLSQLNQVVTVTADVDLQTVISLMWNQKVHRLAVVQNNESHDILNVVSQLTIIDFLNKNVRQLLPPLYFSCSLKDLGIGLKKVISVKNTDLVIDVIDTMFQKQIRAVCIVDEKQQFVGSFSSALIRV